MAGSSSVGSMSSQASTPIATTARYGTRLLATVRHRKWPGTALSRENANIIRDADVTDAVPQKNCATTAITSRNSAHFRLIDVSQMYVTMLLPALSAPAVTGIANVTATRSRKPKMTETTTDITIPQAAARDAPRVSSDMCADAS